MSLYFSFLERERERVFLPNDGMEALTTELLLAQSWLFTNDIWGKDFIYRGFPTCRPLLGTCGPIHNFYFLDLFICVNINNILNKMKYYEYN